MSGDRANKFILKFSEIGMSDVNLVGGKNASLGEMYRKLGDQGVKIPNGYAVTAHSYFYFLEQTNIRQKVNDILKGLKTEDVHDLQRRGADVRKLIMRQKFPVELEEAIYAAYEELEAEYGAHCEVAVRSSATAEDLPDASFAGQQETFLNVSGEVLLDCCKRCMASLFTDRAISYRQEKGFDHYSIGLSIGVQLMVRSDKASSGVMFSLDTESGFRDVVLINAAWGLGENVVQGAVNPDEFYVFKPTLETGHKPLIQKRLGSKEMTMVYDTKPGKLTTNVTTSDKKRQSFCLSDDEVLQLARWAIVIENHYSKLRNNPTPMDMEWAKDGNTGELYIVQARPETVHSNIGETATLKSYALKQKPGELLTQGSSVGKMIGAGRTSVIHDLSKIGAFKTGDVLVTEMTDPDWEPILKKASAVVTDRGGRTCHAAIISRELGIPCIVGCGNATQKVLSGMDVTIDCSSGEIGRVWEGLLDFEIKEENLDDFPETETKIMLNLANPEMAFATSFIPNSGVGLARMEFIVSNYIKVHPLALLNPSVLDPIEQDRVEEITRGFPSGGDFFIEKLAQGVGMICAAFYPKKVILRFSDFKTNEYAGLLGGSYFEPEEENPMIGWRGASRYYDELYRPGFKLECLAIKKVREEFGLTNLTVMIPFVRTVDEAKKVLAEMASNGLERSEDLQVYAMCEIPSNVLSADAFLEILDGFSIGSNDLTQLTLGVDRDSDRISHLYDERNPAVKRLITMAIEACNAKGKYVGICGQAPSDFPEFAEFLVEQNIQTMSLNPDTVISTTLLVAEKEKNRN